MIYVSKMILIGCPPFYLIPRDWLTQGKILELPNVFQCVPGTSGFKVFKVRGFKTSFSRAGRSLSFG